MIKPAKSQQSNFSPAKRVYLLTLLKEQFMETTKELNVELKEEVNKMFADLFKEIGSNRVQLANKVMVLQKEIHKELNKTKVDAHRKKEILREVANMGKMAAQQLPHHLKIAVKSVAPPSAKKKK